MRDESGLRSVGNTALLLAGSMAVAGASLIVGSLIARAIFERGSLSASLLVAGVVLPTAVSAGYFLRTVAIRRLVILRSPASNHERSPVPISKPECAPPHSRLRGSFRAIVMGAKVPPTPSNRALHKWTPAAAMTTYTPPASNKTPAMSAKKIIR